MAPSSRRLWEVLVGLELHLQLRVGRGKLFSLPSEKGDGVNRAVASFDAALPGSLPKLNVESVGAAVAAGLALGGEVQRRSEWDRKHYMYADLPHGYQITQQRLPLIRGGQVTVVTGDGEEERKVRIERAHLEVDTGKTIVSKDGNGWAQVDLNRAGTPLLEIVTAPDMRSGDEAAAFVSTVQAILRTVGASAANMEDGNLRADVNVSVRSADGGEVINSERCEVKNLNSLDRIRRAVAWEASRHRKALEAGENTIQETRTFDVATGQTKRLRGKESALDYRFMPEPDLPPLILSDAYIRAIEKELPELPHATIGRLVTMHQLKKSVAEIIVGDALLLGLFESLIEEGIVGTIAARWITGPLIGGVRGAGKRLDTLPPSASAERQGELLRLIDAGQVTDRMARRQILPALLDGDDRPLDEIVLDVCGGFLDKSSGAETDELLLQICRTVLSEFSKQVEEYRGGRTRLMGLFVGEVLKRTQGRANPKDATKMITDLISQEKCH